MRLGVPHVLLDKQGRARPEIAALYSWRYTATAAAGQGKGKAATATATAAAVVVAGLGNLPAVEANGTGELDSATTTSAAVTVSTGEAMAVDGGDAAATTASAASVVGGVGGVVSLDVRYQRANAGFVHSFQFVDVGDFQGRGESQPTPYFYQVSTVMMMTMMMICDQSSLTYDLPTHIPTSSPRYLHFSTSPLLYQNLGEAEYVVAVFQYMRLLGYPADSISIITSYNGQVSEQ